MERETERERERERARNGERRNGLRKRSGSLWYCRSVGRQRWHGTKVGSKCRQKALCNCTWAGNVLTNSASLSPLSPAQVLQRPVRDGSAEAILGLAKDGTAGGPPDMPTSSGNLIFLRSGLPLGESFLLFCPARERTCLRCRGSASGDSICADPSIAYPPPFPLEPPGPRLSAPR